MKKRVCIIGHFGMKRSLLSGQTIKTRIVGDALERQLGKSEMIRVDTEGGLKKLVYILLHCFGYFRQCKNLVMLPAQNGLLVMTPILWFFNLFFRRRLHYVVIGGWLSVYLKKHRIVRAMLRSFYGIYVETAIVKTALEKDGYKNIFVMPNCKPLKIVSEDELKINSRPPYRLCTFSRVIKEKGIEDAIDAVKEINRSAGNEICELDIYGQIDEGYVERFSQIRRDFPGFIKYAGTVAFDKTTDVLKDYYALLFPTQYKTEGIPGTIIDALAAGIPTIAHEWDSASVMVEQYKTGIIYPCENAVSLTDAIRWIIENDNIETIKMNSVNKAREFLPENVIQVLIAKFI